MKQYVIYGAILGMLLVTLEVARYRWLFIQNAESLYTGFVATVCAVAGIWGGSVLAQKWQAHKDDRIPTALSHNIPASTAALDNPLSQREQEVLALMAEGCSNQQIAERLYLSLNTVKTHISNIFAKLDVERRTQAVQRAKERGILVTSDE